MRPRLAPGFHVLRRGDGHLQVGLDRSRAVVLPETPQTVRALDGLLRGELGSEAEVPEPVRPVLRRPDRKVAGKVAVVGFGHPCGEALVTRLRSSLVEAGWSLGRSAPDVSVLAGVGEPPRELVDPWAQAGTPHLLVRLVEGDALVGPFVAPGRTACLRCVDAATADEDPAWPLLVHQYAALSARDRRDGVAEPLEPAMADLACAWAVRDVTAYLYGHRPSTWSATLRLDPLLHDIAATEWLRHPECGCAWTMEA